MQTSLIETREIEAYLKKFQQPEDSVLFQAKLILQSNLAENVKWQEKTYQLIRIYSRKKLREEIAEAEKKLFEDTAFRSFRNKITSLFKH